MGAVGIGNFWGRNFGDDLMLLGFLQLEPESITVLCQANSDRLHLDGVTAVPLGLKSYIGSVRRTRRVVVVGGTHLQFFKHIPSAGQYRVLVSWLVLALVARAAGAKPEMEGIGLGPLQSRFSRLLTRATCLLQHRVSSRDSETAALLTGWGIATEIVDDLALHHLRRWIERPAKPRQALGPEYLIAAPAYARCDPDWWAKEIVATAARFGVGNIVFLGSGRQSDGDDATAIAQIMSALEGTDLTVREGLFYDGDPDRVVSLLAGATVVIAARYHVALVARALGRPVIPDHYHPKVAAAMAVEPLVPPVAMGDTS